uniref:F-box/kelch-repeat protein n=1 Tax=Chenopodium quinoa TaxID=63459 RepID=A0A803MYX1_CHEQI
MQEDLSTCMAGHESSCEAASILLPASPVSSPLQTPVHPSTSSSEILLGSVSSSRPRLSGSKLIASCPTEFTWFPKPLLSASNGLLCFHLPTSSTLLVYNLLSRSSILVRFPKLPFSFEFLTLVSCPYGFKIFIYSSKSIFLYDSKTRSWRIFDGFDPILNDNIHQQGVYCDGFLYFTISYPFSIVSFDLENGIWRICFDKMPTNELTFARLVIADETEQGKRGKKLYVIGGEGRNGISRCLKLWELEWQNGNIENNSNKWVEVESLPELVYKKLRFCITGLQGGLGIGCPSALIFLINGAVDFAGFPLFLSFMLHFEFKFVHDLEFGAT